MNKWLINKGNLDLDQEKTFYGPYAGYVDLFSSYFPRVVKVTVDALNGKKMSLREAVEKIKLAIDQSQIKRFTLIIYPPDNSNGGVIILRVERDKGGIDSFQLIRFRNL